MPPITATTSCCSFPVPRIATVGGTMSGEHGVGIAKAPYIDLEITEQAAVYMKTIKNALDPNNILNPGKIFLEN